MLWKLGFLALITGTIFSVVLSANIVVVRWLNPVTNQAHFADLFSNPGRCSSSTCPVDRSVCAGGACCMCQCLYDFPNVLIVNGTSARCTNYGETNRISSANCHYSFRAPNEPLEVIPLTETAPGKIKFKNDSARVDCNENGLSVDEWQSLDANGHWENGSGNVFTVDFKKVGGQDGNKKDLTFLKWNEKLDAKYAGSLIKLSLSCAGRNVGCILAKINGTKTYHILQSTTSAPPSTTSQKPSTSTPSTPVSQEATASPSPSTSGEPDTSGSPTTESTPGPTPGSTTVKPGVSDVPGTGFSSTGKAPTQSAEKQQASNEITADGSKAVWPVVGTIGGLICLICFVCLIVALYKRRKRRLLEKPAKDPGTDSEAKLEDYQDPVYAELPDNTKNAGEFDNPIYCDATEEQIIFKRTKQDPLPDLPVDDSTYQPLDQNTRTAPGPSAQAPPPVSYPLKDALKEESSDYLNPDREEPNTDDYDNPPVTNQGPMNNDSPDYDNPPIQGNRLTESVHRLDNFNNDSSDYDNPPIQGPAINSRILENLNNESSDYDNPPVQDIPRDVPLASVPGSTQDAITEPEYFELEPENSSL